MRLQTILAVTVVTALTACSGTTNSIPAGTSTSPLASRSGGHPTAAQLGLWPRSGPAVRACGMVSNGYARCLAWIRTDIKGMVRPDTPQGYGPSDLQTAYGLTSFSQSNGGGETVAIVDAFDDPNAASDLATYRAQYGLPPCTTSSGCFTKYVLHNTGTNAGWAEEESLDVDMVSAICPNCKILLVEAKENSTGQLTKAEIYATAHANYVSNSWAGGECCKAKSPDFDVPGVAITAATGDDGHNTVAAWPAILPTVIAVGGTTLTKTNPRTESAWSGAGSGCSTKFAKPTFQTGINTGCAKRAQADVSADANPNTGVAFYDTFDGAGGWGVVGGTSVATPIIASVFALAGNTSTNNPGNLYANTASLNDVTSGSNGSCGAPLCTAGVGWDGPTGLGTPNGIGAF
ncbi:MAG TPA: S8 family serine peptidase [Candidatus Cybelea sp.]|jgi:subtilase family serine protease|nr:S8 family serine peptidase [Candidatus Cybelea sp.]